MHVGPFFLLFIFALMPAAVGAQPVGVSLIGEGRDNVMQNWEVSHEKWRAQPKWHPSSTNPPPLPIAKAVEIADSWLRKRHADVNKLALSQVMLRTQSQTGHGVDERWFYRIEFQPVIAGRKVWGADLVAVVLFDGTVVVPRSEPYATTTK
ncbi:hypothetical protein [Ramlibacter sp. WS9]|uniref:hypothetical protein n=1 Tax=Ramlibacter sp. WS9 TaxID=1882741 RepID=UPI0011436331|nr:hypothetical protein [Ramlibacter sp. WS9]ROZ63872.1 hypothetical protein EEB15_29250 [Ramlibacter sp. WS9]